MVRHCSAHSQQNERPGPRKAGSTLSITLLMATVLAGLAVLSSGCTRTSPASAPKPQPAGLYRVVGVHPAVYDFSHGEILLGTTLNSALVRMGIDPQQVETESQRRTRELPVGTEYVAKWTETSRSLALPGESGAAAIPEYAAQLERAARTVGAAVLAERITADTAELTVGARISVDRREIAVQLESIRLTVSRPPISAKPGRAGQTPPSRVSAVNGTPRVAIIIDDWGMPSAAAQQLLALPLTLNMSVIPFLPASRELAREGVARGWEVLVHLPMQPLDARLDNGDGLIRVTMTDEEIGTQVRKDFAAVPGADGTNNHMGSRATADPRVMQAVLREVLDRGWFFVDSRTTPRSIAPAAAREVGVRYGVNSMFLDDVGRVDYIRDRIRLLLATAKRRGAAIGIGHVRPATVEALREAIGEIEDSGVTLVSVRELVDYDYPTTGGSAGKGEVPLAPANGPQPAPAPPTPTNADPVPTPSVPPAPVAPPVTTAPSQLTPPPSQPASSLATGSGEGASAPLTEVPSPTTGGAVEQSPDGSQAPGSGGETGNVPQ